VTDLTLFLQAEPFSGRGFRLYDYYQSLTFPPALDLHYYFVGLLPRNTSLPPNIAMPENYLRWRAYPLPADGHEWPVRETAKRFFVLNYALEHTTARWIWCGCDDIYINFDLLLPYIQTLERYWDPLQDVVVRGDCIPNGPLYHRGGPGSIYSRAAVRRLAPFGNWSIWALFEGDDDKRIGLAMEQADIDVPETASSAFIGFDWTDDRLRGLRTANYSDLQVNDPCPKVALIERSGCRKFVAPLNQVVFYHVRYANFSQRLTMAKSVWNAPPWLFFHHDAGWESALCRYTGEKLYEGYFPLP
jgi:hypothetical protein